MTRTRVADRVFLVRFDTQYALASTFLRFQEHYESPKFRNRVFSLETFMDWYAARHGAFTYYEDWAGFNVPSTTFDAFRAGRFDPLLEKERRLLRLFEREREPFYVIGTASDAELTHELAHAFYFTRPAYRREVRAAVRGHDTSTLQKHLREMGYHRAVVADEVQAYLVSGARSVPTRQLAALRRQVQAIYRRHAAQAL
jgi:hypothetical protein